ncbi:outer spore coat protein CotE [Thermoactinomyces mirandus]|uniref:Outer spore coat protein CotE n=1 Tax=Thermoactinomyces mirandus TaxID=2756294 RepID=A0A7W1XS97_9BACL|nr:outer spore coat protein CotE [Thermoactinomyces mirandus]MBA4602358.1 outer spore coat protein CotE [Thermoactinomyces mirandus]
MVSYTDRAVEYRQILTKAVCGKGRKFSQATHTVSPPENIHTILGAWVINHQYECSKVGEAVEVSGSYDVNIWYSTKGNTKTDVIKETVYYTEQVPMSYYDRNTRESSVAVSAAVTQAPNCVEASIASHSDEVVVRVEKEFVVEMVGETKICVPVYPLEYAEADDKELVGSYGEMQNEDLDEASFDDLDPDLIIDDLED